MQLFVKNTLRNYDSFEDFLNAASNGSVVGSGDVAQDAAELDGEMDLEALRSLLCAMLETSPGNRADGKYI